MWVESCQRIVEDSVRVGFITCVQLGLSCMEEIYRIGGKLDVVYTMPDHRRRDISGRVYLDAFCREHNLELFKFRNINSRKCVDAVRNADLDWLFVLWSQIAKPQLLQVPRRGCLCMHPSLLPQGRGRAAVPTAILKGLTKTGVTLFQLDEGMDTGPILAQEEIPVARDETATTLYSKVARAHKTLIGRVWHDLVGGRLTPAPQDDSKASVWPGRRPEDGRFDATMRVAEVDRLVRAVTHPYPGAFTALATGETLRVWSGRPSSDVSAPPPRAHPVRLADGDYLAVDYEIIPAGETA